MVFATKIAATYTGAIDGTTGVAVEGDGLASSGIAVTVDGDGRQAGGTIKLGLSKDYYVPSGATLAVPAVVNPNLADPYRWTLDRNSNTIFGSYSGKVIN
jgi:hypothetical protein